MGTAWRLALWPMLGCAVLKVACSSYAGDEGTEDGKGDAGDAATTDATALDATADATNVDAGDAVRCDPTKDFPYAVPLPSLSSPQQDYSLTLTPDELTVFLTSARIDGGDAPRVFTATRQNANDPFPAPVEVLLGAGPVQGPAGLSLAGDGRTLFFSLFDLSTGKNDLYMSTRSSTTSLDFSSPTPLTELNDPLEDDVSPTVSPDADEIFFISHRTGAWVIYRSTKTPSAGFRPPAIVNELVVDGGRPLGLALAPNRKTIYFGLETAAGLGALDVWSATRNSAGEPFGTPKPVPNISSNASDTVGWVSPDDCRLYFASGRDGGGFDYWLAARPQ